MVVTEYEFDHSDPQKIPSGRCILTLYLTTSTHRRGGNNGNNRAETMQKPTKKSRNNAFLAEKRLTAALGAGCRRFESCHSDQKISFFGTRFFLFKPTGLIYHHALACISSPKAYIITPLGVHKKFLGLMIYNAPH